MASVVQNMRKNILYIVASDNSKTKIFLFSLRSLSSRLFGAISTTLNYHKNWQMEPVHRICFQWIPFIVLNASDVQLRKRTFCVYSNRRTNLHAEETNKLTWTRAKRHLATREKFEIKHKRNGRKRKIGIHWKSKSKSKTKRNQDVIRFDGTGNGYGIGYGSNDTFAEHTIGCRWDRLDQ